MATMNLFHSMPLQIPFAKILVKHLPLDKIPWLQIKLQKICSSVSANCCMHCCNDDFRHCGSCITILSLKFEKYSVYTVIVFHRILFPVLFLFKLWTCDTINMKYLVVCHLTTLFELCWIILYNLHGTVCCYKMVNMLKTTHKMHP